MDAALLDTCVLLKSYLCDTLLSVAEEGAFRPMWSDHVLAELRRNLVKAGAKQEAVEHRLGQMTTYFPDARVTGYEKLIGSMTNHPKDRHVLARAQPAQDLYPRPTAQLAALLEGLVLAPAPSRVVSRCRYTGRGSGGRGGSCSGSGSSSRQAS
jgi:PIN domain